MIPYRLYREHKYLTHIFYLLYQQAATADLSNSNIRQNLKEDIDNLYLLLQGHAEYEESRIHLLLKEKNSSIFVKAENEHHVHVQWIQSLYDKLNEMNSNIDDIKLQKLGYEIYLLIRNFFAEILQHFSFEEEVIMPELTRLCTNKEICEIDYQSYRQMTPVQMIHMVKVLFPHMNPNDRLFFLQHILYCEAGKFKIVWKEIAPTINIKERKKLELLFKNSL